MCVYWNVSHNSAKRSTVNRTTAMRDSRNSIDKMNLIRAQLLLTRLLAYGAVSASQHIFKALGQFLLVLIMTVSCGYALAALRHLPIQHLLAYFPGRRRPRRSMSTCGLRASGPSLEFFQRKFGRRLAESHRMRVGSEGTLCMQMRAGECVLSDRHRPPRR